MTTQKHHELASIAEGHHGAFSRSEALAVGIGDTNLFNDVRKGRYRQLQPGVYSIAGSPRSVHQQMAAAVLSMPALAALSHRTAAELWGLMDRGIRQIDVVTTRTDRVRRSGIEIHESNDLVAADIDQVQGLPVTNPVRTVVDLGAVSPWAVEAALEAAVRKHLLVLADVERFVDRVARRGRRGVGVIRPLLEERRQWDAATESALEDLFRRVVAEVGLPTPVAQYVVRDDQDAFICRADFAYPNSRLLIELDSEAHHMDRMTFRRDRSKQNRATVLGWTVLRYTWWDLRDEPYRIAADIRNALGRKPPT
ncbi:MAG: DUF559 domain-containing protein [Acidimicrobiia bacterium]|nr:DUF559 domain-containing protein [Acidimicrobiia bacterium]